MLGPGIEPGHQTGMRQALSPLATAMFLYSWAFFETTIFLHNFEDPSCRMPIVLRTFTSSSRTFVDLSYRALLFIDAKKELNSLVAMNARWCSLSCCRQQTKQWTQRAIVSPFVSQNRTFVHRPSETWIQFPTHCQDLLLSLFIHGNHCYTVRQRLYLEHARILNLWFSSVKCYNLFSLNLDKKTTFLCREGMYLPQSAWKYEDWGLFLMKSKLGF